ncbi:MAG: chromosome segregation protein SMC [Candidatus Limnocylindrales bacterium]
MTAPPRLLGLRLHGFKSFAERTVLEFGGGISAIVGPNGSGKSNLADALRWALGEQGRTLRTRKSEDVVFAGSERRAALGMADVTLIIDNADGLLPVEYSVLELGRRLYRSGENDYLLNRNRIRLRDLVDLLDAAHLADNAFLFIGQGMVDQALSLRPEERRPLFEEVAGVRRHERRRRRAEEQLAEADANLARVLDIVGELRPRVRRLAAQAEQQSTRESAGRDLVGAILLGAHARWHGAYRDATARATERTTATDDAATARSALLAADAETATASTWLASRTTAEVDRRVDHDAARAALARHELEETRLVAGLEAVDRDRQRLEAERAAAQADLDVQRRLLAGPVPPRDADSDARASEADRELADALRELAELRSTTRARGEALASIRRADAARAAELEAARRRSADAARRLQEERSAGGVAASRQAAEEARCDVARRSLATAIGGEAAAVSLRESARAAAEQADGLAESGRERATAAAARVASTEARLTAERARLDEDERRPIARAARRLGGRRIDAGLDVDPAFRLAVELALGGAVRGYVVPRTAIGPLSAERGVLAPESARSRHEPRSAALEPDAAAVVGRARALGGGPLIDAIRSDPEGIASRIVAAVCWVPDLPALLEIQPHLPAGRMAVVRDGTAMADPHTVVLGRPDGIVERRDLVTRLETELAAVTSERDARREEMDAAAAAETSARRAVDAARAAESAAAIARRRAEDEERAASRSVEAATREALWHAAQRERLEVEDERARSVVAGVEAAGAETARTPGDDADGGTETNAAALATWEARLVELRERRDRLAAERDERDATRREIEARRARAEAAIELDADRLARGAREADGLAEREHRLRESLGELRSQLAAARDREQRAASELDELRAAAAEDRRRLESAELAVIAARERARAADERSRATEVAELEARLGLESLRESLLVELGGLGDVGLRVLVEAAPSAGPRSPADHDIEAALGTVLSAWATMAPPTDIPSGARLAQLRRRFHDLGAADPSAVEEFAEVRSRLEALETQERDLRAAIDDTRRLIADLATMVADQFRTTFQALERAFDARFQQLFGGGSARLALTDPDDLSATGVEIVARPPGKKAGTLAILSGGERALTAVALLFAMLEVRPVPFCVLDEVDAALDEANVGRFADALRSLADRTQFIVITHNRGTIEAADALYGVTVGDDSVSRVISLRLDEATAIAARSGEGRSGEGRPVAVGERMGVAARPG